jgi:hypothetical protein
MIEILPIPSIPGAFANSFGEIKLPEASAQMPYGGARKYQTKWVSGGKRRASKNAKHYYFGIVYRGKNYKVHRLVCEAFHGPPSFPRAVVLHLDENSLNNAPKNLRWGTQKENLNMPKFIEYCKSRTGKNSPFAKGQAAKIAVANEKMDLSSQSPPPSPEPTVTCASAKA